MVDKEFCMSSYLALRYVEKRGTDFCGKLQYSNPVLPSDEERISVHTANDIGMAIKQQLDKVRGGYRKTGILLSGGMDSAILASYLPGCEAYTFRFLGGEYQKEELQRAEYYARSYGLNLHYVDICWDTVLANLEALMISKGGPVHSIEPQICQGARQAREDGDWRRKRLCIRWNGSAFVKGLDC